MSRTRTHDAGSRSCGAVGAELPAAERPDARSRGTAEGGQAGVDRPVRGGREPAIGATPSPRASATRRLIVATLRGDRDSSSANPQHDVVPSGRLL